MGLKMKKKSEEFLTPEAKDLIEKLLVVDPAKDWVRKGESARSCISRMWIGVMFMMRASFVLQ